MADQDSNLQKAEDLIEQAGALIEGAGEFASILDACGAAAKKHGVTVNFSFYVSPVEELVEITAPSS